MKRERPGFHRLSALSVVLLGLFACTGPPEPEPLTAEEVLASEEVIEGLRASLGTLSKSVLNLEFPDAIGRTVFEPEVEVVDLNAPTGDGEDVLDLGLTRRGWSMAVSETSNAKDLSLWSDFLKGVDFFHHFSFYNIRGGFEGEERSLFHTETGSRDWHSFPREDWRRRGQSRSRLEAPAEGPRFRRPAPLAHHQAGNDRVHGDGGRGAAVHRCGRHRLRCRVSRRAREVAER